MSFGGTSVFESTGLLTGLLVTACGLFICGGCRLYTFRGRSWILGLLADFLWFHKDLAGFDPFGYEAVGG